jgi:hypothetical protein
LGVKEFPRRHTDDADAHPLILKKSRSLESQSDFRSGSDEDQVRTAVSNTF